MVQISKVKQSMHLRWVRVREAQLSAAGQTDKQMQQLSPAAPLLCRKRRHQAPVPAGSGVYLATCSHAGTAAALYGGVVPPPALSPSPPLPLPPPPTSAASPSPPPPPTPAASLSSSPPPGLYSLAPIFRVLPKMKEPLTIKEKLIKEEDIKEELIKEEPVPQDD
ncbi:hypothetical protein DFH29DRAFT_879992 [Suillus ampliporus]|nr:hypothetical protein DFH29DRAFT_879992 [Suillus ampliporus]